MENYLPLFLQNPDAIITETADGIEVSLDNGANRFHLNGTAKRVWELTTSQISLDEIVKNIHNTYGQSLSLARNEVLEFLDDATRYGLILQFISTREVVG